MRHPKAATIFFLLSAVFLLLVHFPLLPDPASLLVEEAEVKQLRILGKLDIAYLLTKDGRQLVCKGRGVRPGCASSIQTQVQKGSKVFTVWHDGSEVFQVQDGQVFIFSLEDIKDGRTIGYYLSALSAFGGLLFAFPAKRETR